MTQDKIIKCSSCGKSGYVECIEFDDGTSFCRECCEKDKPVQDSFIERKIEEFKIIFHDIDDNCIVDVNYEPIISHNNENFVGQLDVIEYFISKALEDQRTELLSCLPEFKIREPYDEDFNDTRWNDCREQFLTNLKSKGLIEQIWINY